LAGAADAVEAAAAAVTVAAVEMAGPVTATTSTSGVLLAAAFFSSAAAAIVAALVLCCFALGVLGRVEAAVIGAVGAAGETAGAGADEEAVGGPDVAAVTAVVATAVGVAVAFDDGVLVTAWAAAAMAAGVGVTCLPDLRSGCPAAAPAVKLSGFDSEAAAAAAAAFVTLAGVALGLALTGVFGVWTLSAGCLAPFLAVVGAASLPSFLALAFPRALGLGLLSPAGLVAADFGFE